MLWLNQLLSTETVENEPLASKCTYFISYSSVYVSNMSDFGFNYIGSKGLYFEIEMRFKGEFFIENVMGGACVATFLTVFCLNFC